MLRLLIVIVTDTLFRGQLRFICDLEVIDVHAVTTPLELKPYIT